MASVRALNIGLVNCKVNQNETLNVSGTLNVESSITVSNGFTNSMNTVNTKGGGCFIHTTVLDGLFNSSDEAGRAIAYIPNESPFYDKDNFLYDSATKQALALYNMIDTYFDFSIDRGIVVDPQRSVIVTSTDHTGGSIGMYFSYDVNEWEAVFGVFVTPIFIHQTRDGVLIKSDYAKVWSFGQGRWDSGASDGDWQIGDKIALQIFLPDVSGRNTNGVVVNRKASIDTYNEYASLSASALAYSASEEAYLFNNVLKMDAYGFGGNCSVAVMFKLGDNVTSQFPCIFWFWGTHTNGVQYRCVLDITDTNLLRVVIKEGGGRLTNWGNDPLTVGEWYHIVLVNTTSEIKLYINGSLRTHSSTGGLAGLPYVDYGDSSIFTSSDTNPAFWIGGAHGENRRLVQSYIKYFAIFNEVLDETQIIKLWNLWFEAEAVESVDLGTYDSYSITTNDTAKLEFTSSRAAKGFIEEIENPPEASRVYSSVVSGDSNGTGHAQSMLDSPQAWSADEADEAADETDPYMTIDLGSTKTVIGVITQGRNPANLIEVNWQWVTEYQITSSENGSDFFDVDGGTTFVGNTDASTKVSNYFYASVRAQYIRFHPIVSSCYNYTSMRAGVITSVWKTIIGQVQNSTIYSSPELDVPKICNFDLSGCRVENGERLSFRTSEGWGESYIYGVDNEEKAQLHNFYLDECYVHNIRVPYNYNIYFQTSGDQWNNSRIQSWELETNAQMHNFDLVNCRVRGGDSIYFASGSGWTHSFIKGRSDLYNARMWNFDFIDCRVDHQQQIFFAAGGGWDSYLIGRGDLDHARMWNFDLHDCRDAGLVTISDDRAKHNEVDISNCLATLNKLKPKFYIKTEIMDSSGNEYPRDHNFDVIPDDATYESGLIAQEISNNAIELRHLVRGEEYDASGNPQTLSVNYTGLHAYEVGAIQELLKRVEYLEQRVGRVEYLEQEVERLKNNQ